MDHRERPRELHWRPQPRGNERTPRLFFKPQQIGGWCNVKPCILPPAAQDFSTQENITDIRRKDGNCTIFHERFSLYGNRCPALEWAQSQSSSHAVGQRPQSFWLKPVGRLLPPSSVSPRRGPHLQAPIHHWRGRTATEEMKNPVHFPRSLPSFTTKPHLRNSDNGVGARAQGSSVGLQSNWWSEHRS